MTWKRLEAGAIDPELADGLAARVADPMWFLARQWQVGEFRGEDAATPVLMEADVRTGPITSFWIDDGRGNRQLVPRGALGAPLEALAEREAITTGPAAVRVRIESGAALLRRLVGAGADATELAGIRQAFPVTGSTRDALDPLGTARIALVARQGVDGVLIREKVTAAGGDPAKVPELARFATVVSAWMADEAAMFSEVRPGERTAWTSGCLEYRFGLTGSVGGRTVDMVATGYPGGRLDWHHLDVRSVKEPAVPPKTPPEKSVRVLPLPLRFGGMPASRWWEFEDGDAYISDMAGGPEDLARSVVGAYAAVAGDDWFVVPCTLAAGSLAQVGEVRVLDDFGTTTVVRAAAVLDRQARKDRPWRWFEQAGDSSVERGLAPLVYLPPVVPTFEQGRPLEAVEVRRDEMANLAWAIERTVESKAGRSIDRDAGPRPAPLAVPEDGAWRYQMATDVPDHWVPLVPCRIDGQRPVVVLRRGRLAASTTAASTANRGLGCILEPDRPFLLREEEVPAGGVRVTRRFQLARSADGGVHLWVGRQKRPSGGPMQRSPYQTDVLTGYESNRS
jgi:hypothetical protein